MHGPIGRDAGRLLQQLEILNAINTHSSESIHTQGAIIGTTNSGGH